MVYDRVRDAEEAGSRSAAGIAERRAAPRHHAHVV